MTGTALISQRDGPVVTLTLNRPEALNALSRALIAELTGAIRALSSDDTVRAVVLTGTGRAFSAGVDLKELEQAPDAAEGLASQEGGSLLDVMLASPHPIIAAVNGFAITGGLELALMADFILASEEARFADTHARVGISPSWGMTQILPRLIGLHRARQMSLTGGFVDAKTALQWGLVTEVLPPAELLPRAQALAAGIAETDRRTLTRLRGLINHSAETGLRDGLAAEVAQFHEHLNGVTSDTIGRNRQQVTARGQALAGSSAHSTKDTE